MLRGHSSDTLTAGPWLEQQSERKEVLEPSPVLVQGRQPGAPGAGRDSFPEPKQHTGSRRPWWGRRFSLVQALGALVWAWWCG